MTRIRSWFPTLLLVVLFGLPAASPSLAALETPFLAEKVASGKLPPVDQRIPPERHLVTFDDDSGKPGQPGGDLTMMMARAKDVRILFAYSYARLVAYNTDLNLEADILKSVEAEDNKVFTSSTCCLDAGRTAPPSRRKISATGGKTSLLDIDRIRRCKSPTATEFARRCWEADLQAAISASTMTPSKQAAK